MLADGQVLRPSPHPTQQRLRILMVTGAYPTEKVPHSCTYIKSQVESLIEAGHEVEVIHPRPGPVALRYARATVGVFFKTFTGRFDIVHGHYGLWCLVARLQWTTPVVAAFLGSDVLGEVRTSGVYTRKGALVTRVSRWLCRHVDAVTVKTEEMKKVLGDGSAVVIPDGVDFSLFRPIPRTQARAALGWDLDRYYVVFGNDPNIPVKGFPLAQAAIEHLRARGVPAELKIAAGLPQTTVVQYINAGNALLLPSIQEGSPNIVKEAMACNVPVVATEVGDVADVIGRTAGCFVCPHDAQAIAAALEQALRHEGPTTGRADVAHLERSAIARRILDVYKRAVLQKPRAERVRTAPLGRRMASGDRPQG